MDLFDQVPVVSDNPLSLLGQVKPGANVGLMSKNSKAQVLVARTDSEQASPSRQTHETDTPDTTKLRRSIVSSGKSVPLRSTFDLKNSVTVMSVDGFRENCSHVARRSGGTTGSAGMGTSCERGVHSSRKEEHLARTRGEGDEVRDQRQFERMPRPESKEQVRV